MGQYYRPLIIYTDGKLEVLNSFDFGNMQKLMEHSWIDNEFLITYKEVICKFREHNGR